MRIIDISTELLSSSVYPGDPEPRLQRLFRTEIGDEYNLSALYTSLHTGTHIDAPSHVIDDDDAQNVEDIQLDVFMGPCTVISLPEGVITGEEVEEYFPKFSDRVLVKTGGNCPFLTGAAEDVASMKYRLLGIDGISFGNEDNELAIHRALLGAGTVLLEGLDLSEVEPGEYVICALPVKIGDTEAAFCRAVLLENK